MSTFNGIKNLLKGFFHSSLYLSLASSLVGFSASVIIGITVSLKALMILFFGTFSAYTLNRYTDLKEDFINHPERTEFIQSRSRTLKISFFISYIVVLILALMINIKAFIFVFFPIVAVIVYGAEFPKGKLRRVKEIFLVKNSLISFVWAASFLAILFFDNPFSLTLEVALVFASIFTFTFLNTTIFDIRDVKGDRAHGINTLPVKLGKETTKKILLDIDIIFTASVISLIFLNLTSPYSWILVLTSLYLLVVIFFIGKLNKHILADVLGDGWLMVYGLLGILFTIV